MNRTRAPSPYDNCTRTGQLGEQDYYSVSILSKVTHESSFFQNFTYTFASCQNSCLQRLAWKHCKCVDPLYRKADEHTHCSTPADSMFPSFFFLAKHTQMSSTMTWRSGFLAETIPFPWRPVKGPSQLHFSKHG